MFRVAPFALAVVLLAFYGLGSGASASEPSAPFRPTLFIEHDPDGTRYLRVQEQRFETFASRAPQRNIIDRTLGPAPGRSLRVDGQSALVERIALTGMRHGLLLVNSGEVSIYDYSYIRFDSGRGIHGAAIKIGDSHRPSRGRTYIQRVFADGLQSPDPSYRVSNTDFIGIERGSAAVLIRDVTGRNFGDAGIDTKAQRVLVMNATLQGAHRMVRVWRGAEIVLVNTIINAAPGRAQVWLYDDGATVRYHNVLWCQGATAPSPSDPNCRSTPFAIEAEKVSPAAAAARITALDANPLPDLDPFFATRIDRIRIERSEDGGRTWRPLELANTGENGVAPAGDPRYRIPAEHANGLFRAWYERNGRRVGETSLVLDARRAS